MELKTLIQQRLQTGRNFVISGKQEQATQSSDFELMTWLVIKGPRS